MTAAKHTPGPWMIGDRTVYALNEQGYNRFFCAVQDAHTDAAELAANARLIAAAPELLELLKWAVAYIESIDGQDTSCDKCADLTDLRAAIVKATGAA